MPRGDCCKNKKHLLHILGIERKNSPRGPDYRSPSWSSSKQRLDALRYSKEAGGLCKVLENLDLSGQR